MSYIPNFSRSHKNTVRVATTANITLSGAQTIDAISAIAGDRVLVKDQTTGSQNGIYVVAAGAWSRAGDADQDAEVKAGLTCFVSEGTTNGNKTFLLTTDDPIVLGTTSLVFAADTSGTGDVTGPGSSTDNAFSRFDGTTGKLLQNSLVTSTDTGETAIGVNGTAFVAALTLGGTADPNTGLFHPAADVMGFTASGVENIRISGTEVVINDVASGLNFRVESSSQEFFLYGANSTNRFGILSAGSPTSTLHLGGSISLPISNKTGAYTLTETDYTITADASSAGFTVTLPTAVGITGRAYVVKKVDASSNLVTVDGNGSETIDGSLTMVLGTQYESVTLQSTGTAWVII